MNIATPGDDQQPNEFLGESTKHGGFEIPCKVIEKGTETDQLLDSNAKLDWHEAPTDDPVEKIVFEEVDDCYKVPQFGATVASKEIIQDPGLWFHAPPVAGMQFVIGDGGGGRMYQVDRVVNVAMKTENMASPQYLIWISVIPPDVDSADALKQKGFTLSVDGRSVKSEYIDLGRKDDVQITGA